MIQNLEPQQDSVCNKGPTRSEIHTSKLMKIPTLVPLSFDYFVDTNSRLFPSSEFLPCSNSLQAKGGGDDWTCAAVCI